MIYIYFIVLALGAVISFLQIKKTSKNLKWLLPAIFILTLISELSSKYLVAELGKTNHWWINLFLVLEYFMFSAIYFLFFNSAKIKTIILSFSILFLAFSTFNILFIQGFEIFNTYTVLASGFLILCWVFLYFRSLLQSKEQINLLREPMFWISSGLLVFYLGNVFVAGTIDYFIKNDLDTAKVLLQVIKMLNIVMFSLFIVALLCRKPQAKS